MHGRSRSSHEMVTRLGVRCSTYAFATRTLQDGMGCGRSVDVDSFHGAPARERSQRVRPMTIPPAPPGSSTRALFGASSFHVVTIVCPGPEERRSTKRTERSARNVRVARARNAAPDVGAQRPGSGNATERNGPAPAMFTAKRVGARTGSDVGVATAAASASAVRGAARRGARDELDVEAVHARSLPVDDRGRQPQGHARLAPRARLRARATPARARPTPLRRTQADLRCVVFVGCG